MKKTRFGWLELIVGIAMVAMGIYAFIQPGNVLQAMVRLFGVVAILSGMRDITFYCRTERYTGFRPCLSLCAGIVSLMSGVMLVAYPGAAEIIISIILPIWVISRSVFLLSSLTAIRIMTSQMHYILSIVTAVVGLIAGIAMIFMPAVSLTTAAVIMGIYLLAAGITSIAIAFSKTGFFK